MAARVGKDTFEAEVLKSEKPVLVEFYSDTCIPCKQMSPVLGDIEDDYEEQLKVVKVNVNFDAELAADYSVMASPTILFFKDGEEVTRLRGLQKKADIEAVVKILV
ncbi:MAG: thioredoxin fold domain-containing protein [Roseburia sp.]|nr:thioredoxin fold domain-containing protein [Roseburia sp.]